MIIDSACPSCRDHQKVKINGSLISCQSCDFEIQFLCPICNSDILSDSFKIVDGQDVFNCRSCQNTIPLFKIKQLIETNMMVNYSDRCKLCNSPTIQQPSVNLSSRCFFYPNCSGQAGLFAEQRSLVFLDFETTGLDMQIDEIIEIGALKIEPNGFESVFQQLVKPSKEIHEAITKITGISNKMVESSPLLEPTIKEFYDFIGDSIIVVHNADFDLLWLISSYLKYDLTIPSNNIICTLNWAKLRQESRCSLGALTKKYGICHNNAHRALADAVATKELYFIFENMSPESKPIVDISSFLDLSKKIVDRSHLLRKTSV